MSSVADQRVVIRRALRDGDPRAIVDLHKRVYVPEYGMGGRFLADVATALDEAAARGWPDAGGGVWLLDGSDGLAGSLALTVEGDGVGRVRWFVFSPELRGRGVGRLLVAELVDEARAAGLRQLELVTFSALTTAAHIYRSVGFRLVSMRETEQWGPRIDFQCYELDLE